MSIRGKKMKVAVMGCVVNGPGEAREADLGIAGGDGVGLIFRRGEIIKKVPQEQLVDALMDEIAAVRRRIIVAGKLIDIFQNCKCVKEEKHLAAGEVRSLAFGDNNTVMVVELGLHEVVSRRVIAQGGKADRGHLRSRPRDDRAALQHAG